MPSYSIDGKMALVAADTVLSVQATATLPRRVCGTSRCKDHRNQHVNSCDAEAARPC